MTYKRSWRVSACIAPRWPQLNGKARAKLDWVDPWTWSWWDELEHVYGRRTPPTMHNVLIDDMIGMDSNVVPAHSANLVVLR